MRRASPVARATAKATLNLGAFRKFESERFGRKVGYKLAKKDERGIFFVNKQSVISDKAKTAKARAVYLVNRGMVGKKLASGVGEGGQNM
jgi:hypothetical protein